MKTGDKERGWCVSWFSGRQTQDGVVSSAVYWGATCVKGRGRPRIEAGWGGGTVRAGCTPDRASVHPLESPQTEPSGGWKYLAKSTEHCISTSATKTFY